MAEESSPPFEQLDFLYTPSGDVAADLEYFTHRPLHRPTRLLNGGRHERG
jgi:hypothetical protein